MEYQGRVADLLIYDEPIDTALIPDLEQQYMERKWI